LHLSLGEQCKDIKGQAWPREPSLADESFKYFSLLNGKETIVTGSLGLERRRETGMKAGPRAKRGSAFKEFFYLALFQVIELCLNEPF
jgi:hypothetical protein